MPASCGASAGLSAAEPPCAASTCSQSPSLAQMSAIASSGSKAPVGVVPALPTTAIGCCPRLRAAAISARSASGRMRKRSSLSTAIAPPAPKPMICAARAVE